MYIQLYTYIYIYREREIHIYIYVSLADIAYVRARGLRMRRGLTTRRRCLRLRPRRILICRHVCVLYLSLSLYIYIYTYCIYI